jgi:hypothetical protein
LSKKEDSREVIRIYNEAEMNIYHKVRNSMENQNNNLDKYIDKVLNALMIEDQNWNLGKGGKLRIL